MPICFVVHLFITIVNDGYLSQERQFEQGLYISVKIMA